MMIFSSFLLSQEHSDYYCDVDCAVSELNWTQRYFCFHHCWAALPQLPNSRNFTRTFAVQGQSNFGADLVMNLVFFLLYLHCFSAVFGWLKDFSTWVRALLCWNVETHIHFPIIIAFGDDHHHRDHHSSWRCRWLNTCSTQFFSEDCTFCSISSFLASQFHFNIIFNCCCCWSCYQCSSSSSLRSYF